MVFSISVNVCCMKYVYIVIAVFFIAVNVVAQNLTVNNLQCEHKTNPIGIDNTVPEFSWQLQSFKRGILQTAYRVLVADKIELLQKNIGNIWDTKKVYSSNSTQISFNGKKIITAAKYFWKVQVWDNKNNTQWSETANFTTGLFELKDWSNAKWIGYEEMPDSLVTVPGVHSPDIKRKLGLNKLKQRSLVPLFRKSFTANHKIANAVMYISGLGHYELSINGQNIGNSFLAPGWTNYDKRVLYNTYDVTETIKKGNNAIGVIVGNGFFNINRERYIKLAIAYGYPKMICKLIITYSDGSSSTIVSDASWKTAPSPITFSSIFGGEDYDANLEKTDWNTMMYNDAVWKQALTVAAPKGKLESETDYPVKVNDI
ncbi:MAG: hypothetical protein RIS73_2122, partial [Bacteroidota bacterium]